LGRAQDEIRLRLRGVAVVAEGVAEDEHVAVLRTIVGVSPAGPPREQLHYHMVRSIHGLE
jgi:hypothetical protein